MSTDAEVFEAHRPRLLGIAYRMLGSLAEAEDVVGDVAERWTAADGGAVDAPEAWLVAVTSRRALDVLRSARLRRVEYTGEWLPEPIATARDPALDVERLESLTIGFLVLLERLTPLERAVLVLHDALDHPHDAVAAALGRTPAACRQALRRARRHVTVPQVRGDAERRAAEALATTFLAVGLGGDIDALLDVLAPDVVVTSDGGGIVHAAMRPVRGRQRVARYLTTLAGRGGADPLAIPTELNGEPGLLLHAEAGWIAVVVHVEGRYVTAVDIVVNPAKLQRLVDTVAPSSGRPAPWASAKRFRNRGGRALT